MLVMVSGDLMLSSKLDTDPLAALTMLNITRLLSGKSGILMLM